MLSGNRPRPAGSGDRDKHVHPARRPPERLAAPSSPSSPDHHGSSTGVRTHWARGDPTSQRRTTYVRRRNTGAASAVINPGRHRRGSNAAESITRKLERPEIRQNRVGRRRCLCNDRPIQLPRQTWMARSVSPIVGPRDCIRVLTGPGPDERNTTHAIVSLSRSGRSPSMEALVRSADARHRSDPATAPPLARLRQAPIAKRRPRGRSRRRWKWRTATTSRSMRRAALSTTHALIDADGATSGTRRCQLT